MTRVEPRLDWARPAATASSLAPVLSRYGEWAPWALAISALAHAGFLALIATVEPPALRAPPPPLVEVDLVVPAMPEAPRAQPDPEAPPAQAVRPVEPAPPPEAPAATVAQEPPEPTVAEPAIKTPESAPAPPVKTAKPTAPPPKRDPAVTPEQPPRSTPAQTAARPPAPESGRGVEGTASPRQTDMGAEATVKAVVSPAPRYPRIAIDLREEGTVVVRIEIDEHGVPKEVTVLASSGYGSLDQAAVRAAHEWRFSVPKKAGRPVATVVDVPMRFTIKDGGR